MMKRYSLMACAMAAGLAFAGALVAQDICSSNTASASPDPVTFGSSGPYGGQVEVMGGIEQAVSTSTGISPYGNPLGGAGYVFSLIQEDSQYNVKCLWQTAMMNQCNIPCPLPGYSGGGGGNPGGSTGPYVRQFSGPWVGVPCIDPYGKPYAYASQGDFFATGYNMFMSPCDGGGPWKQWVNKTSRFSLAYSSYCGL